MKSTVDMKMLFRTAVKESFLGHLVLSVLLIMCPLFGLTAYAADVDGKETKEVRQCLGPNEPVGTPRGIFPGRVVWSHSPGAAFWDGTSNDWFSDSFNDQEACNRMMDLTIGSLAGTDNMKEAWNKLFRYFNSSHGKGDSGYRRGEVITVKINNNNTDSHADNGQINASPQMVYSLVRSLTKFGGVPQQYIVIAEPSRFITDYLYNKIHADFPKVRFIDNSGSDGREKAAYTPGAMHYSKDNGQLAAGIATVFTDASYVINMALLKGHVGQGVTLCGKNWYGTMSINPDWRKNHHNNFDQSRDGKPKYMTFVDFMGHDDLGGKCMLWLIDALYGCRNVDGAPGPRWKMKPFNGDWPSSLFGSLDPVALDMVGLDFLTNEFPDMPDVDYSDMYLVEAARAGNSPSGTVYNPNGGVDRLKSLGVAEHWNNKEEKHYSGAPLGIDLIYVGK